MNNINPHDSRYEREQQRIASENAAANKLREEQKRKTAAIRLQQKFDHKTWSQKNAWLSIGLAFLIPIGHFYSVISSTTTGNFIFQILFPNAYPIILVAAAFAFVFFIEWIKRNALNTAFFEFIKYGKYDKQNIAFAAVTVIITAGMSLYGAMTFPALYYGKQNTGQAQSSTLTSLSESKMEAGDAMHALTENTKYIATKNDWVARNRTQKMLQQRADSAKAEVARWQRKADEEAKGATATLTASNADKANTMQRWTVPLSVGFDLIVVCGLYFSLYYDYRKYLEGWETATENTPPQNTTPPLPYRGTAPNNPVNEGLINRIRNNVSTQQTNVSTQQTNVSTTKINVDTPKNNVDTQKTPILDITNMGEEGIDLRAEYDKKLLYIQNISDKAALLSMYKDFDDNVKRYNTHTSIGVERKNTMVDMYTHLSNVTMYRVRELGDGIVIVKSKKGDKTIERQLRSVLDARKKTAPPADKAALREQIIQREYTDKYLRENGLEPM